MVRAVGSHVRRVRRRLDRLETLLEVTTDPFVMSTTPQGLLTKALRTSIDPVRRSFAPSGSKRDRESARETTLWFTENHAVKCRSISMRRPGVIDAVMGMAPAPVFSPAQRYRAPTPSHASLRARALHSCAACREDSASRAPAAKDPHR